VLVKSTLGLSFCKWPREDLVLVAETYDRLGGSLNGWGTDDVLALGAAAAMRIQLQKLSAGGLRSNLARQLSNLSTSDPQPMYLSAAELATVRTAEPLLHPAILRSLHLFRPQADKASDWFRLVIRDAELSAAAYAHSTEEFCALASIVPADILACSWDGAYAGIPVALMLHH